jgi:uncharacterized protein (TIGR02453 family)
MAWHVYLARCSDGSLYTGVTTDPEARIRTHNRGQGASYTRSRRPVTLAYLEPAENRSSALRREWAIKQMSRFAKQRLLDGAMRREVSMSDFTGFRGEALEFFRRLTRRNTRTWFEKNRPIYDREIRAPLHALVEAVDVALARRAPEIVGDPKRSMFRIHRDVRFSRDKSPYKTHAACWFYHRDAGRGVGGEAAGGAGFYFQLSPDESLVGGGIWMPPRPSLERIREAIVRRQAAFEAIVKDPGFRRRFGALDQEVMLKRLPSGYQAGHPASPWLRYQSFTVGRELSRKEALSSRLPEILERDYAAMVPLVRFLNSALGFPPARRRL